MRLTVDGFPSIARVYEFGGANAAVEVVMFKKQSGPDVIPPRTDPSRFTTSAFLKDGRKVRAEFRSSPGLMWAGEVHETKVAEFGPRIRLSDIKQIDMEVDGMRRSFRLTP